MDNKYIELLLSDKNISDEYKKELIYLRDLKSDKERALYCESKFKQQCQKDFNKYKEKNKKSRKKGVTTKVRYFQFLWNEEVTKIYNERNDTDDPWFDISEENFKKENEDF